MRRLLITGAVLSLALALLAPAGAAPGRPGRVDPNSDAPTSAAEAASDYVVVELKGRPIATYRGGLRGFARTAPRAGRRVDLTSRAARAYGRHLEERRSVLEGWMRTNAARVDVLQEFEIVANAVAVDLNGVAASRLARAPKVKRVTETALYAPTMNVSNELIDADPEMWSRVGGESNAGRGMKVAIIDTGIDLTNRFFNDAGYPATEQVDECAPETKPGGTNTNNKVIVCRVYASGNTGKNRVGLIAFDHGTHVAGTVAGNEDTSGTVAQTDVTVDNLGGVVPNAYLGDYNVFPGFGGGYVAFGGSAFSHDIAAAVEDAVADGMDVANLSLGGSVQGPNDFLQEAINRASRAGMVVAVAAGNSGPGDATVESPGSAELAITAAASTNPHFVGIPVTTSTGKEFGAAVGDFNPFDPPVQDAPFVVAQPAQGCTAITNDVSGKIALIDRGTCSFTTKIRNAQEAGAVGVLVINNSAGDPTAMAHDGTEPAPTIPAAMVGKNEGAALKADADGSNTMTVDGTAPQEFITENEDIIANFSSRGPAPFTYLAKPDVAGPGVNVLSSVFDDEFAFFQGTSMATPHVAGAAALLLQAHENWDPVDVRSALITTGKRPVYDSGTGTQDTGVLTRGGGRIDLDDASSVTVTLDKPITSFGFFGGSQSVDRDQPITLENVSSAPVTCALSVITTDGDPSLSVTVNPASVTLAPGATGSATLSADGGKAVPSGDYEGDLKLDCTGKSLLAPWWLRVDRKGK